MRLGSAFLAQNKVVAAMREVLGLPLPDFRVGSAVAEDRDLLVQQQTSATSTSLILKQEGAPRRHLTSRQIARKTGRPIHRFTVVRITRDDLREVTSQVCDKTTRAGAVRSKLYQPFAIKLT